MTRFDSGKDPGASEGVVVAVLCQRREFLEAVDPPAALGLSELGWFGFEVQFCPPSDIGCE
jgi:hypothetical protein